MGMVVVSITGRTDQEQKEKMSAWCKQNIGGMLHRWTWFDHPLEFHFADENDAIMFRLRWL